MAHPYTTEARVRLFLGTTRCNKLFDRDEDGSADSGLIDDAIERICNRIDSALGGRYVMPCAESPSTPGSVADLCDLGVAMLLYQWLEPGSDDYIEFRDLFQGEDGKHGLLGSYRDGTDIVLGLSLISDTSTTRRPLTYESAGTTFAGRVDDDYSEDGVDKSAGF